MISVIMFMSFIISAIAISIASVIVIATQLCIYNTYNICIYIYIYTYTHVYIYIYNVHMSCIYTYIIPLMTLIRMISIT